MFPRSLAFCNYHADKPMVKVLDPVTKDLSKHVADKWDIDFLPKTFPECFELMLTANFLDIDALMDLTSAACYAMVLDESVDDMCTIMNIPLPTSPEDVAWLKEERKWVKD